jgi:hypothetical protein
LGLRRRAKDVGPTLADYLAEDQEAQRAETSTDVRYAAAFGGKPDIERTSQKGRV